MGARLPRNTHAFSQRNYCYSTITNVYIQYNIQIHTYIHVWQSRIEIKYYSVAYFERITEFDAV